MSILASQPRVSRTKSGVALVIAMILGAILWIVAVNISGHYDGKVAAEAARASTSTKTVNFKLTEGSNVRFRDGNFVVIGEGGTTADLEALQSTLAQYPVKNIGKIFKSDEAKLDREHLELSRKSGKSLKNLNTWLTLSLENDSSKALAEELKRNPLIETAYPAYRTTVNVSPSYVSSQTYRHAAVKGVDADYASTSGIPGAKGENVKVVDVEFGWNRNHEDLTKLTNSAAVIGQASTGVEEDHGTAVMGVIIGDANSFGVTGIVPNATPGMVVYNDASSIDLARQNMQPGDIMLIEIGIILYDSLGNPTESVPLEYDRAVYDAIVTATAGGITVIETAANGGVSLDDPKYNGIFTTSRPNSGAVMVGAAYASSPSCSHGFPDRSATNNSNYGSRLDVQGYGVCVTTAGYGYANSSAAYNSWYTHDFNGTSSAGAVVAGVAASISSAFEAKNGRTPTPQEVKDLLLYQASPQYTGADAIATGKIGPLPNLKAALQKITGDTTAPSTPTSLTSANGTNGEVNLQWSVSTDNVGVTGYQVFRNTTQIATTGTTQISAGKIGYTDTTAAFGTSYTYTVKAVDGAGNVSAASTGSTIVTRQFADDFRSNSFTKWTSQLNGAITGSGSTAAAQTLSTSTAPRASYFEKTGFNKPELYVRERVKISSSGSNTVRLLQVRNSTASVAAVMRSASGHIALHNWVSGVTTISTTPLTAGTTYDIQMRTKIAGTSSISEVWVNGTKVADLTKTHNLGTANLTRVLVGDDSTTKVFDVTHDNIAVDTIYVQ